VLLIMYKFKFVRIFLSRPILYMGLEAFALGCLSVSASVHMYLLHACLDGGILRLSTYCCTRAYGLRPFPLWCSLYAPAVNLLLRTAYLISSHVCRDTSCDLTFVPPTPAPSPENSYREHYSLFCVRLGTAGRCLRW